MPEAEGLCLQDNQLCTLKGSLSRFKFLETLDLSGNKLCNLAKLLETLGKFQFLQMLNLVVRLPVSHAPQPLMSISQAAEDAGRVCVLPMPCVAAVPSVLLQLPASSLSLRPFGALLLDSWGFPESSNGGLVVVPKSTACMLLLEMSAAPTLLPVLALLAMLRPGSMKGMHPASTWQTRGEKG